MKRRIKFHCNFSNDHIELWILHVDKHLRFSQTVDPLLQMPDLYPSYHILGHKNVHENEIIEVVSCTECTSHLVHSTAP